MTNPGVIHPPSASVPQLDRPIFIVGDGRTGSTLLRSLLSAHSRIAVTPETHFMKRAASEGDLDDGPRDFEAFWSRYTSWVRFQDLAVDPERCLELIDRQGGRSFRAVLVAVLAAYAERLGKPRVGEKTPGHLAYLDHLLTWFPDARIIILRRDPRAVVASKMQTPWVTGQIAPPSLRNGVVGPSRHHLLVQQAQLWATAYEHHLPRWQDDARVRVVAYEHLVIDAQRELEAICGFVGEAYEPAMLGERNDDVVPPSAAVARDSRLEQWRRGHESRANRPVSDDARERWRRELSSAEVAVVEAICAEGMVDGGYAPVTPPAQRVVARAAAVAMPVLANGEATALRIARGAVRRVRAVRG